MSGLYDVEYLAIESQDHKGILVSGVPGEVELVKAYDFSQAFSYDLDMAIKDLDHFRNGDAVLLCDLKIGVVVPFKIFKDTPDQMIG